MKIFCVSGAPGSDLEMVASILAKAGIHPALPASQDDAITMQSWHEHVLSASFDDDAPNQPVDEVGKFSEQLASSLFVANMKSPNWSWTSPHSVWLLDYWRKFDPNIRFVLVYTPPKRALAAALAAHQVSGDCLAVLLETWATYNRELLRFQKRHPKKTILVNAEDCAANPAALIEACAKRWKLNLTADEIEPQPSYSPKPLATYLAEQSLVIQPELKLLQDEMEAAVHEIAPHDEHDVQPFDIFDALKDYSALRDMAVQARTLSEQQHVLALQVHDLEAAVAERSAAASTSEEELSSYKKRLDEASKENEQILTQMHQLQEELERWFLESKKLNEENSAKATAITDLQRKVAALEAQTAARQEQKQLEERNAAQTAQLSKLQSALDTTAKDLTAKNSALEASIKEVQKLKEAATAAAQHAAKLETTSANAIASLKKDVDSARKTAQESQQESELILVQLHQVQEELENYFLQHKAAAQRNKELEGRWQRMLERNPNYCDYASLDVSAADDSGRLDWRFTDLNAAGRSFPELRFSTAIENGVTRLALPRAGGTEATQLNDLSTSEWALTETLCKILTTVLDPAKAGSTKLGELRDEQVTALCHGVHRLVDEMAELPPVLRFDKVVLKREQVNSDYEHLWLRVINPALADMRWPEFEFRLSCANVRPGKFGAYPKLEFPAGAGEAPFEKWFIESYDDFGEKLELRFALPESMDTAVWQELSERDHAFIARLIAAIPSMLERMDDEGIVLARDWSDWSALAATVQRIHGVRTSVVVELPVVVRSKPSIALAPASKAKVSRGQPAARRAKTK
ncbi:MAG TPA: hypothetical protein VFT37_15650 [Telluria sp.]|nr:hypothetical protein [Telluria sp.]